LPELPDWVKITPFENCGTCLQISDELPNHKDEKEFHEIALKIKELSDIITTWHRKKHGYKLIDETNADEYEKENKETVAFFNQKLRREKIVKRVAVIVSLFSVIILLALLVSTFIFIAVLFDTPRNFSREEICAIRIKQLGAAAIAYREVYNCFPPSYTVDKNNKPMHSWRALILPYLKLNASEQIKYNYNESWDSPYNQQFHVRMPKVFCCDFASLIPNKSKPSYAMIIGDNTISDPNNDTESLKNMRSNAIILLVEIKNANFNWLEPVDIPLLSLRYSSQANKDEPNLIGSNHGFYNERLKSKNLMSKFNIVTCDGTVHNISNETNPIEIIKSMSTIDGAKNIVIKNK
jgi:hypothetical protein